MILTKKLGAATVLLLLFLFTSCSGKELTKYDDERFLFGTHIRMIVYAPDKKAAQDAMNSAFEEMGRIDRKYNSKDNGSDIYKLNNMPKGEKRISLDEEGEYLFKKVSEIHTLTDGKYDITIYPLLEVWGFLDDEDVTVPTEQEIRDAKSHIGFENVKLDAGTLSIEEPVNEIDTGSFLKGYAVQKAKDVLVAKGIKHGFVSSLSSIATIGKKPDGTPWRVGVQNPQNPEDIYGILSLNDESMGVSGDYQTYVEIEGKRYHHIIDKNTGYPVADKKMVVTVSKDSFQDDLLSTGFFLMDTQKALDYSRKNGIKTFIIKSDMSVEKTENFEIEFK